MIKRIGYWLGLIDLVWTQDSDGDVRLRVVHYPRSGSPESISSARSVITRRLLGTDSPQPMAAFVHKILTDVNDYAQLCTDGSVLNGTYVRYWFPYNQCPKNTKGFTIWRPRNS